MRLRKPLFIAALTAAIIAAAYTGLWFYARGVALAGIVQWVAAQRDAGYRITHDPVQTGGFPFVVQIRADALSVASADESWSWRTSGLGVEIRPWKLRRIRIEAFGAQNFTLRRDGALTRVMLAALESVAIATIAESGQIDNIALRIREPRLTGDIGELGLWEVARRCLPGAHAAPSTV